MVGWSAPPSTAAWAVRSPCWEAADHILPSWTGDRPAADHDPEEAGVKVEAKASVQKIEGTPGAMTVTYTDKKGRSTP